MPGSIDQLVAAVEREVAARRRLPESTYRAQLHKDFTFRDAAALVPYLRDLGITHLYASPYLKARPGSTHGYDIIDHRELNPEIGSAADYAELVATLRDHGLGQILDTVPNHMGVGGLENPWWGDVLENGPASPFANFFDIGWYASPRPELRGKILLPFLGEPYGRVLEAGQLRLEFADGAFTLVYFHTRFPIAPQSYEQILNLALESLQQEFAADEPQLLELQSIQTAVRNLPGQTETDPERLAERQREKEVIKRRLAALVGSFRPVADAVAAAVARFTGTPGDPASFDLLDRLLEAQPYRLSYWRVADDEINYRRFFDVNGLAALSMERPEVFAATHEFVLKLQLDGSVDGLRIDHPDGLYDPRQYLERLREAYLLGLARTLVETRPEFQGTSWEELQGPLTASLREHQEGALRLPFYLVVEKILGANEPLREDWPVHGTSGYDFLNLLNGLFVEGENAGELKRIYRDCTEQTLTFPELAYQKKFLIMQTALSSELHLLAHQLDRLAQHDRWTRDFTLNSLRHALRDAIAAFPVYRSYIADDGVAEPDRRTIKQAIRRAKRHNPALSSAIFDFIRSALLLEPPRPEAASEELLAEQRRFAGKFQQVTAPVMAKGVEDTAFYVFNRLVSLNEVGGDPDRFGIAPAALHQALAERQRQWPRAMSATSTHDTKRSEDVRARLDVLSEIPADWRAAVERWMAMNRPLKVGTEDGPAPDANEEYFLYQTLVGAWPIEPHGPGEYAAFVERILAYVNKALHEAKVHTSWINPDPEYDAAVQQFVGLVLNPEASGPFLDDLRPFQRRINHYGLFNSLVQTLVKIAAPGMPDTYQGTELWDFSLVDPDNRRPVDYALRRRLLAALDARQDRAVLAEELMAAKHDGRIKLYLTAQALRCRRDHPGLFCEGDYAAIEATGAHADHVFAFQRQQGDVRALTVVPRLLTGLIGEDRAPCGWEVWSDTFLLSEDADPWRDVFTGETHEGRLAVAEVLGHFPVALLLAGSSD